MKTIYSLGQGFKSRPDEWFFYAFLFSFPLSIRKILYLVPINGNFNEFSSASLYMSDILLILTLGSFIILYNNNIKMSRSKEIAKEKMFHVEHLLFSEKSKFKYKNVPRGTFELFKKIYTQLIHNYIVLFPLVLAIFALVSTLWSGDAYLALFRGIKLLEFFGLFLYIRNKLSGHMNNFPRLPSEMFHVEQFYRGGTLFQNSLLIVVISGLLQALIGIFQFIIQRSIGLFWLKESIISPEMIGVAKVVLNGHTWIRAYGLLPHPNILGGFLVFSTLATVLYFKIGQNVPRGTFRDELAQETLIKMFHVEQLCKNRLLRDLVIMVQIMAIILTFSKTAIISLFIVISYAYYRNDVARSKCSTWNNLGEKDKSKDDFREAEMNSFRQNVPRGTFQRGIIEKVKRSFLIRHLFGKFYSDEIISPQSNCSTWNNLRDDYEATGEMKVTGCCGVGQVYRGIFGSNKRKFWLSLFIIIATFALIKPNYYSLFGRSIEDRIIFLNVSRGTFFENPWLGVGSGQYVVNLLNLGDVLEWQYQPVHNVFLLILNELGLFVFLGFIFFLYKLFHVEQFYIKTTTVEKNVPRGTLDFLNIKKYKNIEKENCSTWNIGRSRMDIYVKGLFLGLIFIMLFDHYLWDVQQGQIILWLVLGLLGAANKAKEVSIDKT